MERPDKQDGNLTVHPGLRHPVYNGTLNSTSVFPHRLWGPNLFTGDDSVVGPSGATRLSPTPPLRIPRSPSTLLLVFSYPRYTPETRDKSR